MKTFKTFLFFRRKRVGGCTFCHWLPCEPYAAHKIEGKSYKLQNLCVLMLECFCTVLRALLKVSCPTNNRQMCQSPSCFLRRLATCKLSTASSETRPGALPVVWLSLLFYINCKMSHLFYISDRKLGQYDSIRIFFRPVSNHQCDLSSKNVRGY